MASASGVLGNVSFRVAFWLHGGRRLDPQLGRLKVRQIRGTNIKPVRYVVAMVAVIALAIKPVTQRQNFSGYLRVDLGNGVDADVLAVALVRAWRIVESMTVSIENLGRWSAVRPVGAGRARDAAESP